MAGLGFLGTLASSFFGRSKDPEDRPHAVDLPLGATGGPTGGLTGQASVDASKAGPLSI